MHRGSRCGGRARGRRLGRTAATTRRTADCADRISRDRSTSPSLFELDETVAGNEPVREDFVHNNDILDTGVHEAEQPVKQWTVHPGASKRGRDILVEAIGYSYTVGKR